MKTRSSAPVRGAKRQAAFTLIEVLAALVIVSLGMLGVIQAVGQTASNSAYLREKTIAHWVAMNRLTEVRLEGSAPKIDKTSDEIEMGGRRWRWTMNVTQTPVESIRRIDINVRAAEADEKSSLAFVSGFYGVAIAAPGTVLIPWQGTPQSQGRGDGNQEAEQTQTPNENREPPPVPAGEPVDLPPEQPTEPSD